VVPIPGYISQNAGTFFIQKPEKSNIYEINLKEGGPQLIENCSLQLQESGLDASVSKIFEQVSNG
jgi:hypothetical protein